MKKRNRQITVGLIISLFFLTGCVEKSKYHRVQNTDPRHSTFGFSVEPPPGKGWYEKHKDNSLIYLKKTDPNRYSLQTKATEINFNRTIEIKEAFVLYLKEKKTIAQTGTKHRNDKLDYTIEGKLSTLCVKYTHQYEDHGYKNLKKNEYVIVKNNGLICIHPEVPTNGIEISYMEKSLSSNHHQSYLNEGEMFLNSLSFNSATN